MTAPVELREHFFSLVQIAGKTLVETTCKSAPWEYKRTAIGAQVDKLKKLCDDVLGSSHDGSNTSDIDLTALIDKVTTMREGFDSFGPTGLVCHFRPEEWDEIVESLKVRAKLNTSKQNRI